jgi:hypothetical protein
MTQERASGQAAEVTRAVYTGDQPNPILNFLQRPRIMLLMLAIWSLVGVLAQIFTDSGLFLENHSSGAISLDGALGGLAFGFEGIPLAAVYIYAIKDPLQHRNVYLLGLIHMAALSVSQLYHWLVTDDFSFESVAIPLFVSIGLGVLVFIHLFGPKEHEEAVAEAKAG